MLQQIISVTYLHFMAIIFHSHFIFITIFLCCLAECSTINTFLGAIQKTYKSPNDTAKILQQIKQMALSYPSKPKNEIKQCCDKDRNPNPDAFDMVVFAWK